MIPESILLNLNTFPTSTFSLTVICFTPHIVYRSLKSVNKSNVDVSDVSSLDKDKLSDLARSLGKNLITPFLNYYYYY